MHTRIITALLDSHGPDITGRDVPMPAGSQHEVSEYSLGYFRDHPDVFSIGDAYQTKSEALANEIAEMGTVPTINPTTGEMPGLSKAIAAISRGPQAVIFGASLEAQNTSSGAGYEYYLDRGWFNWMNYYSRAAFTLLKNAGVNGNRSDQMLARFDSDVAAYNPNWLFIGAPINDPLNSYDFDTFTKPNMTAIFAKAKALGCRVHLLSMSPSTLIAADANMRIGQSRYNSWAAVVAAANGWDYADITTPLLDPASTTGAPLTSLMWDSQTHYANCGAQRVGLAVWNSMSKRPPPHQFATGYFDTLSTTNPYGNLIVNPCMHGSSGTNAGTPAPTGAIATSWVQIPQTNGDILSAVGSKVARTDVPGLEWSQSVVAFDNVARNTRFKIWNSTNYITLAGSGLSAGDVVQGYAEANLLNPTNITSLYMLTQGVDNSYVNQQQAVGLSWGTAANDVGLMACSGVIQTPPIVIPAGATKLSSAIFLGGKISTAGCAGTLQVGRVEWRKVVPQ